ncbi:MAG TPA: hypothetical protein PLX97_15775, partial [Gemmatales bacterium]|nr:hypothetical protein [Gemmatales bacterium]
TDAGLAESLSPLAGLVAGLGTAAPAEEVEALKEQLSELKAASKAQKTQLDELLRQMGGKKK